MLLSLEASACAWLLVNRQLIPPDVMCQSFFSLPPQRPNGQALCGSNGAAKYWNRRPLSIIVFNLHRFYRVGLPPPPRNPPNQKAKHTDVRKVEESALQLQSPMLLDRGRIGTVCPLYTFQEIPQYLIFTETIMFIVRIAQQRTYFMLAYTELSRRHDPCHIFAF
jgi:hypothetical protein